ncbi:MAG: hypothetical protein ACHQJ4_00420 [Ignavibacteria bacterium]
MEEKVYKYRMDLYYQLLLIYVGFFFVYAVIKGKFFEEKFTLVFNDPIVYILAIFIALFFFIAIWNIMTARRIILKGDRAVLKNRFGSREILYNEILDIRIGKKRRSMETPYRIIKIKLMHRRKWLRIRANDFEKGSELIREFMKIKNPVK